MRTIFRKELADIFSGPRFFILIILAILVSAATLYADYKGIRGTVGNEFIFLKLFTTTTEEIPNLFGFLSFMAMFFLPFIGIVLGFDAISSERSSGTLSRILAQPIYRDNIINGKLLAGVVTISVVVVTIVAITSGLGLRLIGVPPSGEELVRLSIFVLYAIVYGTFWMLLALLFSILFRQTTTSLLSLVALWLFFSFFIFWMVPSLTNLFNANADSSVEAAIRILELRTAFLRISPSFLFLEASNGLLEPPLAGSLFGALGVIASGQARWMIPNPLSLSQTLLLVWPHLVGMLCSTFILFAISYVTFIKQEIRAT